MTKRARVGTSKLSGQGRAGLHAGQEMWGVLVVSIEGAAGVVNETPALVRGTGRVLVVGHGAAT